MANNNINNNQNRHNNHQNNGQRQSTSMDHRAVPGYAAFGDISSFDIFSYIDTPTSTTASPLTSYLDDEEGDEEDSPGSSHIQQSPGSVLASFVEQHPSSSSVAMYSSTSVVNNGANSTITVVPSFNPGSPRTANFLATSSGSPSSNTDSSYSPDFQQLTGVSKQEPLSVFPERKGCDTNGVMLEECWEFMQDHLVNQAPVTAPTGPLTHLSQQGQQQGGVSVGGGGGPREIIQYQTLPPTAQPAGLISPYPPAPSSSQVSPPTNGSCTYSPSPFFEIGVGNGFMPSEFNNPNLINGVYSSRKRSRVSQDCNHSVDEDQDDDEQLENGVLAPGQRSIRFSRFEEPTWHALFDADRQPLYGLEVLVMADKGFQWDGNVNAFINQKKNHFQISVLILPNDKNPPKFVSVGNELKPITKFRLELFGVKAEMPTSTIAINQSQNDRRAVPYEPEEFELPEQKMTKVTVGRLHFCGTTANNQRKGGRSNPDQKYFQLVVSLMVTFEDKTAALVQSYASERMIVRASNPGQFETPNEDVQWSRNRGVLHTLAPVAIGTDRAQAQAALTVAGNIFYSGKLTHFSDRRLKENIEDVNRKEALENLLRLRVVDYAYKPEVAARMGLCEADRHRTGVIAQEVENVLPAAVNHDGDYLTVNDEHIFYKAVAATQELRRLTETLEGKIDGVETFSQRLARNLRKNKLIGSMLSGIDALSTRSTTIDGKRSMHSSSSSINSGSCRSRPQCRNPECRRNRHGWSTWSQCAIVGLALVMALCLLMMSTLYVFEWYDKRISNNKPLLPISMTGRNRTNGNDGHEEPGTGNIIDVKPPVVWTPPDRQKVPSLGQCATCPIFCCANQHKYDMEKTMAGLVDTVVGLPAIVKPIQEIQAATGSLAGFSGDPLPSGVRIFMPQLNVTVDQRFCVDKSCQPRKGLFDLFLPIAPTLPTMPLTVNFAVGKGRFVVSCGRMHEFESKYCNWNNDPIDSTTGRMPTVTRVAEGEFEISAGEFLQSAYRFRVGYTRESCQMKDEQAGRAFEQYNLFFYRRCLE